MVGWRLCWRKLLCSVGNVYEPYLHLTHPGSLAGLLTKGYCWGAAVRLSLPALSWMGVAVGDPLYHN